MTAVMRALTAPGPKVLRVGIVMNGRLVEERILARATRVTLGSLGRPEDLRGAMFVIDADVPPGFVLFERTDAGTMLHRLPGMTGRIALPGGVTDVSALPVDPIRLDESARGRVSIGNATFLFQFVPPLPPQPRPRLPLSVKGGVATHVDWPLLIVAAFSFLLHFGAVGAMYSDWADTVVDEDITVGLIAPSSPAPPLAPATEIEEATTNAAASATPSSTPTSAGPPKPAPRPAAPSPADVDALLGELGRVNIAIIGGMKGPDARRVLTADDSGPPVDLGRLALRASRIDTTGGLGLPTAGGPITPGREPVLGISSTTGPVATGAGRATTVVPVGDVQMERLPPGSVVPNLEAAIRAQIHPGAKRCYQRGLAVNPTQSGKLVLVLKLSPSGEVASTSFTTNTGLSDQVTRCIAGVAQLATFDSPGPAGATIAIPFGFVRQ
jgi:hypothetical protein